MSTFSLILAWANGMYLHFGYFFDLFSLGILQGVASALLYGPSIAVIPEYFPKNQRSLATGITTCGSSVGAILFGFITQPLSDLYGWRGTLLILAGFTLNGVALALFFKQSLKPRKIHKVNHQTSTQVNPLNEIELLVHPHVEIVKTPASPAMSSVAPSQNSALDWTSSSSEEVIPGTLPERQISKTSAKSFERQRDPSESIISGNTLTAPNLYVRQNSKGSTRSPYKSSHRSSMGSSFSRLAVSMSWLASQVVHAPETFREVLQK